MDLKKVRNGIVVLGIMAALLPWFLYFLQQRYYGVFFSLITTSVAIVCFIAASLVQLFYNKKMGYSLLTPGLMIIGFVALFICLFVYLL